jgi:hypothetical protein
MKPARTCFSGLPVAVALLTLGCAASSDEARFNSDAVSYFKTLSDQGMGAAQAMAGASNLDSVKGALLAAKSVEGVGYEKYFRSRAEGGISSSVHDIADNADEAHRLFQDAMSEFLMYWDDKNTAHITDGSRTLNRCVALANATVLKINARR